MINDCAFVAETLIRYLPKDFAVIHIKRSRGFFDKTLKIAWKILRAKGDIYHVHYLLQDCYLASKFGKHPLIGHAHGSDLREVINSKKWGRIVKHNLKNCEKILVAQSTILEVAKEFNENTEYFPIPYDPKVFYPTPLSFERKIKQVFLASSHNFKIKGTDKLLRALSLTKTSLKVKTVKYGKDAEKAEKLAKEYGLKIHFIENVPHNRMNELYWESDLVLGSFGVGQLDTVAIEAMACGRPVIHHILKEYYPNCPLEEIESVEKAKELIEKLLSSREEAEKRVQEQLRYVENNHSAPLLARRLVKIYDKLLCSV
jgi:glycosyltransferase involved in cell wall biosynthesis